MSSSGLRLHPDGRKGGQRAKGKRHKGDLELHRNTQGLPEQCGASQKECPIVQLSIMWVRCLLQGP